jgi:hypothetical protein
MIVFIDSSILGKICNPNNSQEIIDIQNWLFKLLSRGVRVVSQLNPHIKRSNQNRSIPQNGGYANEPTPINRHIQSLITLI